MTCKFCVCGEVKKDLPEMEKACRWTDNQMPGTTCVKDCKAAMKGRNSYDPDADKNLRDLFPLCREVLDLALTKTTEGSPGGLSSAPRDCVCLDSSGKKATKVSSGGQIDLKSASCKGKGGA